MNATITLSDGRTLGWSEYGDPGGAPVVSCHGGLSSRLDAAGAAADAAALGVRLISPDRPGVGLSDAKPGRTLLDWPVDLGQLLDHLEIERAGITGWSMGGPFAAAAGAALNDRIDAVALIASPIPIDWTGMRHGMHRVDRICTALALKAPGVLRAELRLSGATARKLPKLFGRASQISFDRDSRRVVAANPDINITAAIAEGLRNPAGAVEDYVILGHPWGFDPAELKTRVTVWQGDADGFVPGDWGRRLAARIPGAELELIPGAGHFLAYERYGEILERARPGA